MHAYMQHKTPGLGPRLKKTNAGGKALLVKAAFADKPDEPTASNQSPRPLSPSGESGPQTQTYTQIKGTWHLWKLLKKELEPDMMVHLGGRRTEFTTNI